MEQCHDTIGALKDTVVLSLELAEDVALDSPETIAQILQSQEIQDAIKKTLMEEGKRLAEKQRLGQEIGREDSDKLTAAFSAALPQAAIAAAKRQIEATSGYRDLKASAERLACSFRNSPMGVYIDENKKLLVIVASGLALGGVVSMYALKTGDWPAAQLSRLANQIVQFKPLGNVSVGAKGIKFVPSNRTVEATVFTEVNWKAVKTTFELKVAFQDDKLKHTSGKADFVVPLKQGLQLSGHASGGYQALETGGYGTTYGLGLGLVYSDKTVDAGLTVDLIGMTNAVDPSRTSPELKIKMGLTVRFD